jgi:ferredoxin
MNLTILFGSVMEDDIILKEELEACVCDKVKVVHVLSGENPGWTGEKGFLTAETIKKYSSEDTTYFICGHQVMYSFVKGELEKLQVPARRVRFEVFGSPRDITKFDGYPVELANREFTIKVMRGVHEDDIPAKANESIAVALERAGLKIHTACRSGACGFCRLKVIDGNYYVCPNGDGRRAADKDYNYVHACSTYPTSDMTIRINID